MFETPGLVKLVVGADVSNIDHLKIPKVILERFEAQNA